MCDKITPLPICCCVSGMIETLAKNCFNITEKYGGECKKWSVFIESVKRRSGSRTLKVKMNKNFKKVYFG